MVRYFLEVQMCSSIWLTSDNHPDNRRNGFSANEAYKLAEEYERTSAGLKYRVIEREVQ